MYSNKMQSKPLTRTEQKGIKFENFPMDGIVTWMRKLTIVTDKFDTFWIFCFKIKSQTLFNEHKELKTVQATC
jgi:hypothetical protein